MVTFLLKIRLNNALSLRGRMTKQSQTQIAKLEIPTLSMTEQPNFVLTTY